MISAHAQHSSLSTRERKERLPARHGKSRGPDDLAHSPAQQPVAGQPSPQQHHPQHTNCQPPPDTRSWNRGSQHSGFLPCTGRVFSLRLLASFLRLSPYESQGENIRQIPGEIFKTLKFRSVEQDTTMKKLVTEALRRY
jgi:hypothetical protein